MSSPAGWYPDPGGQTGLFRYWSGTTWSASVSRDPNAAPPAAGLGQPPEQPTPSSSGYGAHGQGYSGQGYGGQAGGFPSGQASGQGFGQPGYVPGQGYQAQPQKKRPVGAWIALLVGVIIVALLGFFVVRGIGQAMGGGTTDPGSNPTTNPCPTTALSGTPPPHPNDGRVHGGMLSYPRLASPWSPVQGDIRVPFGRDISEQQITIHANYDNSGSSWVSSVLVGELVAGDGFYSPQEGSEIVAKCLLGRFYGGAKVERNDTVNKATTLDGKDGWLLETHLTFDIKSLPTKGETAIIMIVQTSLESSSLFYASIPDDAPTTHVQDARRAMAGLKVGA